MGSAGLQLKRHQAVSIGFLDQVVMSDGRFAPVKIHNPFNDRAPFAGKRRAYGAGLRNDMSPDNGKVFPADFFLLSHCGEDVSTDQMFCNDGEAGGVPVKPVAAPEDERFPLLLVIPGQGVGQRVGIIVQGRMDRHPGWFIDHDQIFILVDDGKRGADRRNIPGAFRFLDPDEEAVSGF